MEFPYLSKSRLDISDIFCCFQVFLEEAMPVNLLVIVLSAFSQCVFHETYHKYVWLCKYTKNIKHFTGYTFNILFNHCYIYIFID